MDSLFSTAWQVLDCAPLLPSRTQKRQVSAPAWIHPWLCEQDSMTQRIQAVCKQTFNVRVLVHRFIPAPASACSSLAVNEAASVLHREVLLCDGDTPLVFACSLLPEQALHGRYADLRELGSRPLGHWLFTEPVLSRQPLYYAKLKTNAGLFQNAQQQLLLPDCIWGRKSLFLGADSPFLVSEFFLPHLAMRNEPLKTL